MKAFLPSLISLIIVAAIAGILIAIYSSLDRYYMRKIQRGEISGEKAAGEKSSTLKTAFLIAAVVLALLYVGASNYTQIERARKEEREIAQEEWYNKGYDDGYADGYSDGDKE